MRPTPPPALALAALALVACGNRGELYLESDAAIERELEQLEDDVVQPGAGAAPATVPIEPARRPVDDGAAREDAARPSGADDGDPDEEPAEGRGERRRAGEDADASAR